MIRDLIIIGGGCSGLAAGIYARRFNMNTLILTEQLGGTITTTHLVENYPGFIALSGQELADNLIAHAEANDVEIMQGNRVSSVIQKDGIFEISYGQESFQAYSVLLATGTTYKKLGIPGEEKLSNRGVSYCATCDGAFFKGKNVIMVGGGDSAVKESLILAEHAAHVSIIYRGSEFKKAEPINVSRMEKTSNIKAVFNTNLKEIIGDKKVEAVLLDNGETMPIEGVFIEIGRIPLTQMVDNLPLNKNEKGEIIIDDMSRTNIERFYAAGDITAAEWKQAVVGVAEGVKAAYSAFNEVNAIKAGQS